MANDPSVTMGGVTYRVTPEYLAGASADTTNTAAQIEAQLAAIKSYVYSLQESWGGIAHDRFVLLMADYDILSRKLHNALIGIASGLQGNYVNYSGSEETNIVNLNNVQAGMPAGHQGPTANLT
jgi:WXG100 family type VII secretion target